MWLSMFPIRLFVSSLNYRFDIYQHTVHDHMVEILFDFRPYYEVNVFMGQFTLFVLYTTYLIMDSSSIHLWDHIIPQLAQQNWTQFVKANLTFEPTFRFSVLMRKPRETISEWKEVFQKLQNPDSICFKSTIKHFPYLDRKIRARILLHLFCIYFLVEILFKLTSKSFQATRIFRI